MQVTPAGHDVAASVLQDFLAGTRAALATYSRAELDAARRFLLDVGAALELPGAARVTSRSEVGRRPD